MTAPTLPPHLTRGVATVAASMLAGAALLLGLVLAYGSPLGDTMIALGLRLRGAGTAPVYAVTVLPTNTDETRVRALLEPLAVDVVTQEALALCGAVPGGTE